MNFGKVAPSLRVCMLPTFLWSLTHMEKKRSAVLVSRCAPGQAGRRQSLRLNCQLSLSETMSCGGIFSSSRMCFNLLLVSSIATHVNTLKRHHGG